MARFFNTSGPCRPGKHYMLPPDRRLPGARRLIEQEAYFVLHAPRQSGKTTALRTLAESLTAEGRYAAVLTTCETGQSLEPDLEGSMAAILDTLRQRAAEQLPAELRPPEVDPRRPPRTTVLDFLGRWAEACPRPIVLFLDEVDALLGDVLLSLLRQLRSGFDSRPRRFPQSVALVGLRDIRDYRLVKGAGEPTFGSSSPFNIKADSLTLRNFEAEEVAELYGQHTEDTGQIFTPEAVARAFELSAGQPWLVNALARQCVEHLVEDRSRPIEVAAIDQAKEILIVRRDTHLDSLIDRLREPRVRRVIAPILAGDLLPADLLDDDVAFVEDLGLVIAGRHGLEIANPIYREIVPRALTESLEQSLSLSGPGYVLADGSLDFERLLQDFRAFWLANAEAFLERAPYSEVAAQLVFMAFLHKVVNGGGTIEREFAVGRGRVDLCISWPRQAAGRPEVQRFAIELKVHRKGATNPESAGLEQIFGYLERLGLAAGTLMIFDARGAEPPLPERQTDTLREYRGRQIRTVRL